MSIEEYNYCVDNYADGLYRFLYKNIRKREQAEDLVQDTFERLWVKAEEVNFEKAKSYLFTTAYHAMIDQVRKEKFTGNFTEVNFNALSHHEQYSDVQEILHQALDKLPEIQRSVVLLRDYEGYSYEEIGEITNLNEAQVKVYIYRARLFLKNYMGSLETVI
jgi:RNA polymerase sigma factor (sigma-70 family)